MQKQNYLDGSYQGYQQPQSAMNVAEPSAFMVASEALKQANELSAAVINVVSELCGYSGGPEEAADKHQAIPSGVFATLKNDSRLTMENMSCAMKALRRLQDQIT
ncbi:hypothetical protein GOB02_21775 [Sinorhizobium meliloti]|nr:hypothetical protein [Sinorhizobium meliloti]